MIAQHARRFEERRRARRIVVGSRSGFDGIEVAADDVHELRVHGAAQRCDDVRCFAVERVARVERLIFRLVAERLIRVEEKLRGLAVAGPRDVLRVEVEERFLVGEDARGRLLREHAPHVGGDRREGVHAGGLERGLALQICTQPLEHRRLCHLPLQIEDVHAALG